MTIIDYEKRKKMFLYLPKAIIHSLPILPTHTHILINITGRHIQYQQQKQIGKKRKKNSITGGGNNNHNNNHHYRHSILEYQEEEKK